MIACQNQYTPRSSSLLCITRLFSSSSSSSLIPHTYVVTQAFASDERKEGKVRRLFVVISMEICLAVIREN